jgi:predicted nucleotidyltransferase
MHRAVQQHIETLQADPNVLGILLFGSWARGNNRPDSDIDLLVIVQQGFERTIEYREGQAFEITYTTEHAAVEYWRSSPDDAVELWSIAKVLFDRDGTMARLQRVGRDIQDQGKPPLAPARLAHAQFDIGDQLRAVEELASSDPVTARMILSIKIVQLSELYFDLRQLWTPPPKQRLGVLKRTDSEVHNLIAAYYQEVSLTRQLTVARALFTAVFNC